MAKAIVVLGMHRSGTSLVSRILHEMGVYMGEEFLPPDEGNEGGYWEDTEWLGINKRILARAGGDWANPPHPKYITEERVLSEHLVKAAVKKRERFPVWGFKDPRTCLTAEFIHPFLPSPQYLIVNRAQVDIAQSLQKLHGSNKNIAGNMVPWPTIIEHYLERMREFTERHNSGKTHLNIGYLDLVSDQELAQKSILWIARWVGIKEEEIDLAWIMKIIKFRRT